MVKLYCEIKDLVKKKMIKLSYDVKDLRLR